MTPLRVLDLFSGIGGFSLGLERTGGFTTVAFCEIDPFCRRVLAKHWPGVPIYEDVRELTADRLRADGIAVDVICGGFPCQDISVAGKGAGLAGERSGLWFEYARIIGEIRPSLVIVENVAALLGRGLGTVLGDLSTLGLDAEWHCIPAAAVGAPHRRDRVWIIAYDYGEFVRDLPGRSSRPSRQGAPFIADDGREGPMADTESDGRIAWRPSDTAQSARGRQSDRSCVGSHLCDPDRQGLAVGEVLCRNDVEKFAATIGADWWLFEPDVGRVANGVSNRVDRLRGLGNAVVPQIPELIGQAILESLEGGIK